LTFAAELTTRTITPRNITLVTVVMADTKVYDGGTSATLNTGGAGIITGDTLTQATATGGFTDKNAAAGGTVSFTGFNMSGGVNYSLNSGANGGNLTLTGASAVTTASVKPKNLTFTANTGAGSLASIKTNRMDGKIPTAGVADGAKADNVHKIEKMMQLSNVDGFFKVTPNESLVNVEGAMLKLPPEQLLKDIAP